MAIELIRRATLVSNIAYFEVPCAEPFQVGQSVTVAGCTSATFNSALTVLGAGLFQITGASGLLENWSGFFATLSHANIAIETESGATVTTSFGTSTSSQSQMYDT